MVSSKTSLEPTRNKMMSRVRSENSKAELLVFGYLRKNKVYFQKHYKRAPGSPDIAIPRKKRAVFIDGDFWHGRRFTQTLESRGSGDYWTQKVLKNILRDGTQMRVLGELDWKVLRIWESDINRKRTRGLALNKIKNFLTG